MSYSPPSTAEPIADVHPAPAPRFSWLVRLAMVLGGGVLVVMLAVAARLTPSARGMGTHQQLGLPPCSLVMWAGMRCPSCGMTTSWSHLMRGNVPAAVRANSGGTLLALAAITAGPWLLVSGLRGRWMWGPPRESVLLSVGIAIVAVTLVDWWLRLNWGL